MDNVFFGKGEKNAEGVSTRKVTQITEQLCGTEISATQVSRIAKLLDEELEQFRERGAPGVPGGVPGCPLREGESSRAVFPSVPWQRCQFHLAQNAQAHAHNRAQGRKIGQAIRDIFNCPSLADAEAILTRVAERFAKENLQWVKWLEENIAEGFTVYRFPRSTHKKIRTVNGLERVNKEIRRRSRVVGIFPNKQRLSLEIDLGRLG